MKNRAWLKERIARFILRWVPDFFALELCKGILGREPGPKDLSSCAALIRNSGSMEPLAERLVLSNEFQRKSFAAISPRIVTALYKGLLDRDPDAEGLVTNTSRLIAENDVKGFILDVIDCLEFKMKMQRKLHPSLTEFLRNPQPSELLGPRLRKLNILTLGTCQVGELLNVPGLEFNFKHMLMGSGLHFAVPEVDLEGMDAVVVGLMLRAYIGDACIARLGSADEAREVIERCNALMEENVATLHPALGSVPTFFVAFYEPSFNYTGNLINRYNLTSPRYFVQKLNERLSEIVSGYSNFYFVDTNEIISSIGRLHIQDDIIDESGHASLISEGDLFMDQGTQRLVPPESTYEAYNSASFHAAYVGAFWRYIGDNLKILRQSNPVKLIIVDLDHTLWRGIAAEDNLEPHVRTEGWPMGFVEALLFFKKRGGLLAICSKNDHEPTIERLKEFWGTRITLEDFVSVKINWNPKPDNIAEILSETNLLPDNVVYIDDNPREVDEVQGSYPTMRCLGENHMDWRRIILQAPETQVPVITEESSRRSDLVRARVERETEAREMPREEWLKSLNLEQRFFEVRGVDSKFFDRAFELINKTNQFNTTGKRWELAEMKEFLENGGVCLVTSLKDKTIDNGIIGAALIKDGEIAQAVLSCRVFGLGAEVSMGRVATEIALRQAEKATGLIIDTGKNFTCHTYYTNLGFQSRNGHFEATHPSEAPDWIAIHIEADGMNQHAV